MSDLPSVIDLLTIGYKHDQERDFWVHATDMLRRHDTPTGYPKYGYLLDDRGTVVGVLLTIFSERYVDGRRFVRCNGSSVYVAPAYRGFGALLIKRSFRFKDVTYMNLTPGENTYKMVLAQGYKIFVHGRFVAVPLLGRRIPGLGVRTARNEIPASGLTDEEAKILRDHDSYGCVSLIGTSDGEVCPFVFLLGRRCGIPVVHLIYCRDYADFIRYQRAIGKYFARLGYFLFVLDSNGAIPGLIGQYVELHYRFAMGPEIPRLGDLAYTECPMFELQARRISRMSGLRARLGPHASRRGSLH